MQARVTAVTLPTSGQKPVSQDPGSGTAFAHPSTNPVTFFQRVELALSESKGSNELKMT